MKFNQYSYYKDSHNDWVGPIPSNWEIVPIKYRCTINDGSLPESTDPSFEIMYIDIGSVDLSKGVQTKQKYFFDEAPSRARRKVRDGDVIVSTVRTYLKAIAKIDSPEENLIVSTGFAVVRPRKVNPSFLGYLLRASYFIEQVVANSVGVSYPAINSSLLARLKIILPPLNEQQTIAKFLDKEVARIDTLIQKKQQFIERLKEKRLAVISRAVTRGIDPDAELKPSGVEWLGDIPKEWEVKKLLINELVCKESYFLFAEE